jgi:hypothetical protein
MSGAVCQRLRAACCISCCALLVVRSLLRAARCIIRAPSLCGAADARCAVRVAARGAALGRSGDAAAVCRLHLHGLVRVARRSVAPCGIEEHVRDRPFPATHGTVPGRAIKLNSEQPAARRSAPPGPCHQQRRGPGPGPRWRFAAVGGLAQAGARAQQAPPRQGGAAWRNLPANAGPTAARAGRAWQRPVAQPGQRPAARLLPPARMLPAGTGTTRAGYC